MTPPRRCGSAPPSAKRPARRKPGILLAPRRPAAPGSAPELTGKHRAGALASPSPDSVLWKRLPCPRVCPTAPHLLPWVGGAGRVPFTRHLHLESVTWSFTEGSQTTLQAHRARLVRGAEEGEWDVKETKRPPVRTVLCLAVTEQRRWLLSFFNLHLHLCAAVLYLGRFSHCLTGHFG